MALSSRIHLQPNRTGADCCDQIVTKMLFPQSVEMVVEFFFSPKVPVEKDLFFSAETSSGSDL
jgi:hypothetical protein